jgi:hypothetical protein
MPAGDQMQDQKFLLDNQNRPKPKPKRKFTFVVKKPKKGEGFLSADFDTRNPG